MRARKSAINKIHPSTIRGSVCSSTVLQSTQTRSSRLIHPVTIDGLGEALRSHEIFTFPRTITPLSRPLYWNRPFICPYTLTPLIRPLYWNPSLHLSVYINPSYKTTLLKPCPSSVRVHQLPSQDRFSQTLPFMSPCTLTALTRPLYWNPSLCISMYTNPSYKTTFFLKPFPSYLQVYQPLLQDHCRSIFRVV